MEPLEKYWKLMRLNSTGDASPIDRIPARQYLESECQPWVLEDTLDNRSLQKHLVLQAQKGSVNALLSLRCYTSHHILISCLRLINLYGQYYRFSLADIALVTLNDDGKSDVKITYQNDQLLIQRLQESRFQTLSFRILEKFNPEKAGLGTWAARLTWQDSYLKKLLKDEYGLLLISDWALLNETKPASFKRMLIKYFGFPDLDKDESKAQKAKVENPKIHAPMYQSMLKQLDELVLILQAYHAVYVVDRRQALTQPQVEQLSDRTQENCTQENRSSHRGQSCPEPTSAQYDRMVQFLRPRSPEALKIKLSEDFLRNKLRGTGEENAELGIADYIRRHRLKQLPQLPVETTDETGIESIPKELLRLFDRYLGLAIQQALQMRLTGKRMKPEKAQQLIAVLRLQYQNGLNQTEISKQLNLTGQFMVSRILNFKALAIGIIGHMSQQLKNDTPSLAAYFDDPDRLLALQDQLETYLSFILSQDKKWRYTPARNRADRSQLGQAICEFLAKYFPD